MPRFVGRKKSRLWWDVAALIALIIVVVLVLGLTGTIQLFGWAPGVPPV